MSCEEHLFENLLYHGYDPNDTNRNALSPEVADAIQMCYDYLLDLCSYEREILVNRLNLNGAEYEPCKWLH